MSVYLSGVQETPVGQQGWR